MTTNQTTVHSQPIPPIGYVGADAHGAFVVTGHTDAGAVIERQDGTTETIAPADYPPLPKPGTAAYRIAQVLTRDRSWLEGYTQSVIEDSIDVEDDADQERELLREFPPTTAAIMQIGTATRAALCTEAVILRAGIIEALTNSRDRCAEANDSASSFELLGALRTWMDAGDEAKENADVWGDQIMRPIFDAFRDRTGFRGQTLTEKRDALVKYITTNITPPPAPEKPPAMDIMEAFGREVVQCIRDAANVPAPTDANAVNASPFYRCRVLIDRAVANVMAECDALEATAETHGERVKALIKELIDGSHEAQGAADNLDLIWNRMQNAKAAE